MTSILIVFGSIAIGFIIGWAVKARLPSSWAPYDDLLWSYANQLESAREKARTALAMWDDGDLSGARYNLEQIAQLGEDK